MSVAGASVVGVDLELAGEALDLFTVERVDVGVRTPGAQSLDHRVLTPTAVEGGTIAIAIADAVLEPAAASLPSLLDASDLFSTMQRLMSAGDAQLLNTIVVGITGKGRRAGTGALTLRARAAAASEDVTPGEASIEVHVGK